MQAAKKADAINARQGNALQYQNKGWIDYIITVDGPQAVEHLSAEVDYEHYVYKQIMPIADGILPFIGLSFDAIFNQQIKLI